MPSFNWGDIHSSKWYGSAGPGLHLTDLIAGQDMDNPAGVVGVWNSPEKLIIHVETHEDWRINTIQIYVGADPVPTVKKGNPKQGEFPYKEEYDNPKRAHTLVLDSGGRPWFALGQTL